MSTSIVRILLVDDHAIVREGLRMLLKNDKGLEIVGEAGNGQEAVRLSDSLKPDVILMALSMPIMDGVRATELIKSRQPEVEVVALTSVLEDNSVVGAVKAGAVGYVLKDSRSDVLRQAIRAAAEGKVHLAPEAASRLIREMKAPAPLEEELTEREIEVLHHLAFGLTNKEIAQTLVLGEETIKTHVSHVLSKLNVKSRTQAALMAWQRGWIERR